MGPNLSTEQLQLALNFLAEKLSDIEYFIFYGTLLGICRMGQPIDGDDDIDVMVPRRLREDLIKLLNASQADGILYDDRSPLNQTPYFIQVSKIFDGVVVLIDFYLYDESEYFIIEKWTKSAWSNGNKPLSIPSELVYPLKSVLVGRNILKCPMYPEACCELIYGPYWRIPRRKNIHYETYLENGILKLRRPAFKTRLIAIFPFVLKIKLLRSLVSYFRI